MNKSTARSFKTAWAHASNGSYAAAGNLLSAALRASTSDRNTKALLTAIEGADLRDTIYQRADGCWLAAV